MKQAIQQYSSESKQDNVKVMGLFVEDLFLEKEDEKIGENGPEERKQEQRA